MLFDGSRHGTQRAVFRLVRLWKMRVETSEVGWRRTDSTRRDENRTEPSQRHAFITMTHHKKSQVDRFTVWRRARIYLKCRCTYYTLSCRCTELNYKKKERKSYLRTPICCPCTASDKPEPPVGHRHSLASGTPHSCSRLPPGLPPHTVDKSFPAATTLGGKTGDCHVTPNSLVRAHHK